MNPMPVLHTLSKLTSPTSRSNRCVYVMERLIHFSLISLDRIPFQTYVSHSNCGYPIVYGGEYQLHDSAPGFGRP